MIWYQYIFLVIAVALYSLSQLHQFNKLKWQTKFYTFFGLESWVRKYKHGWKNGNFEWDETKPAYFGSTTFLVWTTDFYHFAQMLMKVCFSLGIFGITWSALIAWIFWTGIQWWCFKLFSK